MTAVLAPQPLSLQRESELVAGVGGAWFVLCLVESRHVAPVHWGLGARLRPAAWHTTPDSPSSPVNGMAFPPLGAHLRLMHVTCLVWEHVGVSDAAGAQTQPGSLVFSSPGFLRKLGWGGVPRALAWDWSVRTSLGLRAHGSPTPSGFSRRSVCQVPHCKVQGSVSLVAS